MTRRAPPQKKSEVSRQQVLDAAVQALAKKGFSRTSVQEIAEEARLSKGAVHYHFESKEDLIVRVLEQCCDALGEEARRAWQEPGPPLERIRRVIGTLWKSRRNRVEFRVMFDLMAQALHEPKLAAPIAAMLAQKRKELLDEVLAGLAVVGLKPKVSPEAIPWLLLGTIDGLASHAFFEPPSPELEAELFKAVELSTLALFTF